MAQDNSSVRTGSILMLIAGLAFVGYAVVFFFRSFIGTGFELGVETLNGVTKEQLNALNPAVVYYINHLHIATAGFIAAGACRRRAVATVRASRGPTVRAAAAPSARGRRIIQRVKFIDQAAADQAEHGEAAKQSGAVAHMTQSLISYSARLRGSIAR